MKYTIPEFDVTITIKPELSWLSLVEDAARSYLTQREFPHRLIEQTSAAIGEATEQLISLCRGLDSAPVFEIGFVWQDNAVQVHMVYDASIPLNPHKTADYEVPFLEDNETSDALDGLWLHIIKRTMDRVFFRIDGKRASLVMIKYYQAEKHARKLWVLGLKPRLRADIAIEHAGVAAGQRCSGDAIIHDLRSDKVLKLTPSDVFILSRLDGKNALDDIYMEHFVEVGPISPEHIKRLYETLDDAGMLESNAGEGETREARWKRWLSPVFSIPHPDKAVTWIYQRSRFMFHPVAVAILFLIGLSGLIPLIMYRQPLGAMIANLDILLMTHPAMIAIAYLLMLGHMALHELAHGVTCKHFGGRVNRIGIMWYMAMFIFFCDVTSAWTFPKKSQRIWVSISGPLVSWGFFGLMAWCAGVTAAEGSPWAVLWTLLTLMCGFGLAMNFNPLIRMDAYYMLVDWTDIPNLQKKAFEYIRESMTGWLRKKRDPGKPPLTVRETQIYSIYGVLSAAMTLLFILLPFWRLANLWISNRQFTVWGFVTVIAVLFLVGGMLFKAQGLIYAVRHKAYKIL
jgi:putative peptide zinc metalloprotease protein